MDNNTKFFRYLLGITKLDKDKNQCIRKKTGSQNIVKEIQQYQKQWHRGCTEYRGWTQTEYQNKQCNTDRNKEGT
jgi:hypothetical protein